VDGATGYYREVSLAELLKVMDSRDSEKIEVSIELFFGAGG
jgi:hypothetical protein